MQGLPVQYKHSGRLRGRAVKMVQGRKYDSRSDLRSPGQHHHAAGQTTREQADDRGDHPARFYWLVPRNTSNDCPGCRRSKGAR